MISPNVNFIPPKNNQGPYTWEIEYAMTSDYLICTESSPKRQHYRFSIILRPIINDDSYYVECREFVFLYWKIRFKSYTKSLDLLKSINEAIDKFDDYLLTEKTTLLPLSYFETSMFLRTEVSVMVFKMTAFPSVRQYVGEIMDYSKNKYKAKSALTNNVNNGIRKEYFSWGSIAKETPYVDGIINGTMIVYNGGGSIFSKTPYVQGLKHGTEKEYSPMGNVSIETPYVSGKIHGTKKHYWENGKLSAETQYIQGEAHGIHRRYDNDGKLTYETQYVRGETSDDEEE